MAFFCLILSIFYPFGNLFIHTPFFRRKVCQRTLARTCHFILAKLLKFQEIFPKSFLCRGPTADTPTDNAYKKRGSLRVFYIIKICWNCVRGPCFKGLFSKSPLKIRKNFPQTHHFIWMKAFEVPRNFSRKVSCVGVPRQTPQLIMLAKKQSFRNFFHFLHLTRIKTFFSADNIITNKKARRKRAKKRRDIL